jgi:hypothetical protein
MKSVHKSKARRIGQIVEGLNYRKDLLPQIPEEELEISTVSWLDEQIRLGELAVNGYKTPQDLSSEYYFISQELHKKSIDS